MRSVVDRNVGMRRVPVLQVLALRVEMWVGSQEAKLRSREQTASQCQFTIAGLCISHFWRLGFGGGFRFVNNLLIPSHIAIYP
jgi:hypothetical protein